MLPAPLCPSSFQDCSWVVVNARSCCYQETSIQILSTSTSEGIEESNIQWLCLLPEETQSQTLGADWLAVLGGSLCCSCQHPTGQLTQQTADSPIFHAVRVLRWALVTGPTCSEHWDSSCSGMHSAKPARLPRSAAKPSLHCPGQNTSGWWCPLSSSSRLCLQHTHMWSRWCCFLGTPETSLQQTCCKVGNWSPAYGAMESRLKQKALSSCLSLF